jgi:hypothetical protein
MERKRPNGRPKDVPALGKITPIEILVRLMNWASILEMAKYKQTDQSDFLYS